MHFLRLREVCAVERALLKFPIFRLSPQAGERHIIILC
jgi:hypothetical protein